ncbi:hypothetical protein [Govanella unica]|uniref:Uncharacterized protein n=1 Tax=Govanella unica TaxID=2975056 RepID=A0A9X3TWE6_9PROT|nr:hypothetical protein [Govania unica]MDA5192804.1 hypothetical protein [Govania unica]
MTLPGCATRIIEQPAPPPVAVPVRDTPPADLLVCPAAPQGFPTDETAAANLSPEIRAAAIRLASAYADLRGRFARLISWHGSACEEAN